MEAFDRAHNEYREYWRWEVDHEAKEFYSRKLLKHSSSQFKKVSDYEVNLHSIRAQLWTARLHTERVIDAFST